MATAASVPKELATTVSIFHANTQLFEKTVQGLSDEKWLAQPGPDSNPLLWIAGHVVVHRALVPRIVGMEWSAPWEKLFARGAKRVDLEKYPAPAEILRAWNEVSAKLSPAFDQMTPELLGRPKFEGALSLDGTVGGTVSVLSLHEAYHIGQMGYLRKWLGYGQTIG